MDVLCQYWPKLYSVSRISGSKDMGARSSHSSNKSEVLYIPKRESPLLYATNRKLWTTYSSPAPWSSIADRRETSWSSSSSRARPVFAWRWSRCHRVIWMWARPSRQCPICSTLARWQRICAAARGVRWDVSGPKSFHVAPAQTPCKLVACPGSWAAAVRASWTATDPSWDSAASTHRCASSPQWADALKSPCRILWRIIGLETRPVTC